MKKFNKITIIGVGLIGGSIGLAIKKHKAAGQVVGVFRRSSTLRKALRHKAVDKAVMDIAEGVKGADLIIIGSPVHSIPALAWEAARSAKPGAIITDVGSTKSWIVARLEKLLKGSSATFVGSHPMAGSEKTGVEFARGDLLEGSPCIVTRTVKTDRRALTKVAGFWKALGAKVDVMDPGEHDRAVSLVSHLPHIVAFSLAGAVPEKALRYAAEGFKDTTRVASSDPVLWSDIFLTNKAEVVKAARLFKKYYNGLVAAIVKGDRGRTVKALASARRKRDAFLRDMYGKKRY
jgi:prephenate dehydrogenase